MEKGCASSSLKRKRDITLSKTWGKERGIEWGEVNGKKKTFFSRGRETPR